MSPLYLYQLMVYLDNPHGIVLRKVENQWQQSVSQLWFCTASEWITQIFNYPDFTGGYI